MTGLDVDVNVDVGLELDVGAAVRFNNSLRKRNISARIESR